MLGHRNVALALLGTVAAILCAPSGAAAQAGAEASAAIIDNEGEQVGTASFSQGPSGLLVVIEANNLPPGWHGMHLHEVGDCSDEESFEAAGDHIGHGALPHGLLNPEGHHPGDMPNLHVEVDGVANAEIYIAGLALKEGEGALLEGDGTALVIHANRDDHLSQPSGGSGDRIACGVLEDTMEQGG